MFKASSEGFFVSLMGTCIIVSGLMGAGKTTIAKRLTDTHLPQFVFLEGDRYHPQSNLDKVRTH